MAYKINDCPATFDFELSDGSVHSMPVMAGLTVDQTLALQARLDAAGGKQAEISKVWDGFIREMCPELADAELSSYVVMQITAAWLKASPTVGES